MEFFHCPVLGQWTFLRFGYYHHKPLSLRLGYHHTITQTTFSKGLCSNASPPSRARLDCLFGSTRAPASVAKFQPFTGTSLCICLDSLRLSLSEASLPRPLPTGPGRFLRAAHTPHIQEDLPRRVVRIPNAIPRATSNHPFS